MKSNHLLTIPLLALLTACNGSSDSDPDDVTRDYSPFPEGLAVSSPTDTATVASAAGIKTATALPTTSFHASATRRIDSILNGTTPLRDDFTPELLYRNVTDASCFGPKLKYEEHPDGTAGNSGELPTGDIGMWPKAEDTTTNEACAAAQLNAQMVGIRDRSMAGLMIMASVVDTLYDTGLTLPVEGDTEDLTTQMNATGITDVTFSSVELRQTGGDYFYDVQFTYTDGTNSYDNSVTLQHEPTAATSVTKNYKGLLTYQIQDEFTGGNCGTATHDITRVGSLLYNRDAEGFLIESREAQFCGHSVVVADSYDTTDKQVDPTARYDMTTNPDGWGNNFSWFIADFDRTDLAGTYSYVWQAGPNDANSRVFRVGLNYSQISSDDGSINADGEAWYGYGKQVFDTSSGSSDLGDIDGFICNWAGPGSSHPLQDYAQRQFLEYNNTDGVYQSPTGGSDLTYAPTASCTYDGSGSFDYDRDLNSTIDGSDIVKVIIGAAATDELEFDLYYPKGGYSTMTVPQIIDARSNLPGRPALP